MHAQHVSQSGVRGRCTARTAPDRRAKAVVCNASKVMIAGPPGCGKGTQCAKIVEKYGLDHISVGDLLRDEVAAGSPIGLKAKGFMDTGNLVPDEVVVQMVVDRLGSEDTAKSGWLLDGYPRSASQAQALEANSIRPDVVLLITVPDEVIVERVVGRRLDPETGDIYHMTFKPPPKEIEGRLKQRGDDTEEAAMTRIKVYKDNIKPIEELYSNEIVQVDGNVPMDSVFSQIDGALGKIVA
eukprot:jgi/Ulvmu1/4521/UM002_0247.1